MGGNGKKLSLQGAASSVNGSPVIKLSHRRRDATTVAGETRCPALLRKSVKLVSSTAAQPGARCRCSIALLGRQGGPCLRLSGRSRRIMVPPGISACGVRLRRPVALPLSAPRRRPPLTGTPRQWPRACGCQTPYFPCGICIPIWPHDPSQRKHRANFTRVAALILPGRLMRVCAVPA
jgi:hypothetical protein